MTETKKPILVIGGGISGITVALETAETGYDVILVEKSPSLGGRVAQMNLYFPKMCPPACGIEINYQRLRSNPRIKVLTLAQVKQVKGEPNNYTATIEIAPRMVNEKCTACNACVGVCPRERSDSFNFGMKNTKAIYLPSETAMPMRYVIDAEACKGSSCDKCIEACKYGAIELDMKPETMEVEVGSIVLATGWKPYPMENIDNLGAGKIPNVISNVMMERLGAPSGPTSGKILRPSDNKEISSVAFVQCAGSRDENHLNYCSAVCCLASLKQAGYVREQYPDAKILMFYIDVRAMGRMEKFLEKTKDNTGLELIKGKVAKVEEDKSTGQITVKAEDTATGKIRSETVDLVVLATGMMPENEAMGVLKTKTDESGFFVGNGNAGDILATGVAKTPAEVAASVRDATGTALKAIQSVLGAS